MTAPGSPRVGERVRIVEPYYEAQSHLVGMTGTLMKDSEHPEFYMVQLDGFNQQVMCAEVEGVHDDKQ